MGVHEAHVDREAIVVVRVRRDDLRRGHPPDLVRAEQGELDRLDSLRHPPHGRHHRMSSSCSRMTTPNERSSSRRSLNAYEVCTGYIVDVFSHTGHRRFPFRSLIAKWPQSWFPHTYWIVPSDSSRRRSLITIAAPWPIKQSRSISPNRRPPWRDRPSVGCRVRIWTGPRERTCSLPETMWCSFW